MTENHHLKISIIIPMYNRATLVGETLDSILAQTYTDWECIVVDDGSTDNSIEVVQKYVDKDSRFKLLIRPDERTKGAPTCRNIGYENSKGEYIYFFDSDDLISDNFLDIIVSEIKNNPNTDYAVFPLDRFTQNPQSPFYHSRKFKGKPEELFEYLVDCRVQVNTQNILWNKKLLSKANVLWNEQLARCQDGDFIMRMIGIAEKGVWLDTPTMVHVRVHSNSIGGQFSRTLEEAKIMFRYRSSLYDYYSSVGKMTPRLHKILLKSLFRFQRNSIVISGNTEVAYDYYCEIRAKSKMTLNDTYIVVLSWLQVKLVIPIHNICYFLGLFGIAPFNRLSLRTKNNQIISGQ
jgi:glycosyltransferase involved in cell wall biosynthesis